MQTQPDLTFYFAIHQAQRDALAHHLHALTTLGEEDRPRRAKALVRWSRGFALELEEHHFVEDTFFFPSLRSKVASAGDVLDRLEAEHRKLDELLARWSAAGRALGDAAIPFAQARAGAVEVARELHDFLHVHLTVEDEDVLPLFWRHFSADEYDAVVDRAVKGGKKAGLWFVAPFTVDCYPVGPARDDFLASVPAALRLLHRLVRPRYDRLVADALGPVPADIRG